MAAISTQHSVSMPVSIPDRTVGMAACNPHHEKVAGSPFVQQYQRTMKDFQSTSRANSRAPLWWFLLNRTGQTAAMKKMAALNRTAPDLTWEEKWAVTEASLRDSRKEQMNGIDEAIIYTRRSLVYEGDSPLPDLFASCVSDDDRLSALLARPSGRARMALDTFSRRTASGQSMTSSFDAQEATIDIQQLRQRDRDDVVAFTETRGSAYVGHGNRDGYESEDNDEIDEKDPVWEALVKSCSLNYGTFS